MTLFNDQGTSNTEGSASIELLSDAGGVELRSTANLANAINLTSDGGTSGTITLFNDQGTSVTEGAASISLFSDAGGVELRSTANLANAINITNDGGTTGTISIFNDQGSATDSISLKSDVGGITLNPATFVTIGGNATNAGEVRILEDTDNGSNYVALKAPNVSTSYTVTLPTAVAASCGLFLKSTCAGVTSWAAAGGSATKEIFGQVVHSDQGFSLNNSYAVTLIDASGESAFMALHIPHDFSSIGEAVIISRPSTCSTPDYDITTNYSTTGQHYATTHTCTINDTTSTVANILQEINIACALSCIAADDYVGIHIERDSAGSHNIIGVRIKYC
jgi:hypothetical protein